MKRDHAADLQKLQDLMREVAREAVNGSEEVAAVMAALSREGVRFEINLRWELHWTEPDYAALEKRVSERRACPNPECSPQYAPFYMKGTIVNDRIRREVEREVVEGLQIRWRCALCGLGMIEVYSIHPAEQHKV